MRILILLFLLSLGLFANAQLTPMISYSTYIGGPQIDHGANIQVSLDDEIYCTFSTSGGVTATPGVHQMQWGGVFDGLVQKRDKSGKLIWSTYFGGRGDDYIYNSKLLKSGKLAVCGETRSNNNISFRGPQANYSGGIDGFLAIFNTDGTLDWSTYFGGEGDDFVYDVSADSSGNYYITGNTSSFTGISTMGSFQENKSGTDDGFLAKFTSDGKLAWSTYIGGSGSDWFLSADIDKENNVWIGGSSVAGNTLSTSDAYKKGNAGGGDGLLLQFTEAGLRKYGTYYGGSGSDAINAIKVEDDGTVWLSGTTNSSSNIASQNGFKTFSSGGTDLFLVKFDKNNSREWATYLGGNNFENTYGIDIDNKGNLIMCASTNSINFQPKKNPIQGNFGGGSFDAVFLKLGRDGSVIWSTYYGNSGEDQGFDIACQSDGTMVSIITTGSAAMHTTNAEDSILNGNLDGLLVLLTDDMMTSNQNSLATIEMLKVIPNPAIETIFMDLPDNDKYSIEVFDVNGKHYQKYAEVSASLNVGNYAPGLYYIQARNKLGTRHFTASFVKL